MLVVSRVVKGPATARTVSVSAWRLQGGGARGHALVHLDRARYEETEALEATIS